jgi:hypothetical protein
MAKTPMAKTACVTGRPSLRSVSSPGYFGEGAAESVDDRCAAPLTFWRLLSGVAVRLPVFDLLAL